MVLGSTLDAVDSKELEHGFRAVRIALMGS